MSCGQLLPLTIAQKSVHGGGRGEVDDKSELTGETSIASPVTKHDEPSPEPLRDGIGIGTQAHAWRNGQRLPSENPYMRSAV